MIQSDHQGFYFDSQPYEQDVQGPQGRRASRKDPAKLTDAELAKLDQQDFEKAMQKRTRRRV
jgi:hypothetical protein